MLEQMQRTGDKCCGGHAVCDQIAKRGDMFVRCERTLDTFKRTPPPLRVRARKAALFGLRRGASEARSRGNPSVRTACPRASVGTRCLRDAEGRAPRRC